MTPNQQRAVRVDVLGPLRVVVDGVEVPVPGERRRAVLALLALAAGDVCSVDEVLGEVWPDELPGTGRRALHSHVSRLRRHLGAHRARLASVGAGYRLELRDDELDAAVAQRLAAEARGIRDTDPHAAVALLAEALGMWRGTALEEFPDVAGLTTEAVALAALRADLRDEWLEARLATGDRTVQGDAARAAAEDPLRERTAMVLIRALAQADRPADAMRVAHDYRERLADATGFSPSATFAELESAVATGSLTPARPAPARYARPATDLVGRAHEVGLVARLLDESPVVTIIGPGGVGKTHLSLVAASEIAARHALRLHVVELATVSDERHTFDAVAAVLGLGAHDPGLLLDAAAATLSAQPSLLVLDNCEHLLQSAGSLVDTLASACPGLRVLCTSRVPLGLPLERLVRLGPLPVPAAGAPDDEVLACAAVTAFVAHARRRVADFDADHEALAIIGEVVRHLDGLPLAIELAAGRVGTFGLDDIRDRLPRALDVLGRDSPAAADRHRTLRATIDWSYQLLEPEDRRMLRLVAAFPGGLDLRGVERLADEHPAFEATASVARLVDASMIVADIDRGRVRYRVLETVRAYAHDMTEQAGDRRTVEDTLVSWAIDLARTLEEAAQGPHEAQANERLTAEFPNLRAAFDVARARTDVAAMFALVLALEDIASFRAFPEIHTWAVEVAEHVAPDDDGRVLGSAAASAWMRGQLELAEDLATRGARARTGRERATFTLGVVALLRGDLTDACDRLLEAVDLASPGLRAVYAATAALPAIYDRDLTRAAEIVALAQRNLDESSPPSSAAFTRYAEGELLAHHDPQQAIAQYEQAIALSREVGATFVEGVAMVGLVSQWAHLGRLSEALVGYRWLVAYWRRAGNWTQMWTTLRNLAVTLAEADDPRGALFVLTAAQRAPGASSVDAHTRAEHDRLITELEDRLGRPEAERVRARAASLPAGTVVDEALAAVEQALQR